MPVCQLQQLMDQESTLCLKYVAVIIEINISTASLHGRMLDISYLARGWQGE